MPPLPILFLVYIHELGIMLKDSGLRMRMGVNRLPATLLYDDVALLTRSAVDTQSFGGLGRIQGAVPGGLEGSKWGVGVWG